MKKKPYKYLKFYHECMENDHFPYLCHAFGMDRFFKLMRPTIHELRESFPEKDDDIRQFGTNGAWASYLDDSNSFRETIVLFMAAMHGEL